MKTFRVKLTFAGFAFVDADHYAEQDGFIVFHRGDMVQAQYAKASVVSVTEVGVSQAGPIAQFVHDRSGGEG